MSNSGKKSKPALGFLTILRHEQHGLFGGYLILNTLGRPLEFHCTAPLKPNRAEILYGPTLEAFLYGEQIGQTLLKQAGIEPLLICTDQEPTLAVREHTDLPVVLVLPQIELPIELSACENEGQVPNRIVEFQTTKGSRETRVPNYSQPSSTQKAFKQKTYRIDQAHRGGPNLLTFDLGRNRLALPSQSEDDRRKITERLSGIAENLDLAEPFDRIRDAIEEAQQALR